MKTDEDLPAFLVIPQERRNATWIANPPKSVAFVDPRLEAQREMRAQQKKIETAARIERMKASLARRPAKVDTTGMRWNVNRSRWEPDTRDTILMNDQVQKYNEIAAAAGQPLLTIKKFENRAIGAQRIEKLQKLVDSKKEPVVETAVTVTAEAPVEVAASSEEEATVAKKAKATKSKTNGKSNGVGGAKNQLIIGLLTRKSGTTVEEAIKATGWKQVHLSAHASKAGLKLKKERQKDGSHRYWAD